MGPLHQRYGDDIVFNMRRSLTAKVSSIIHNGPRGRNRITLKIMEQTPSALLPNKDQEDNVKWLPHSSESFSIKSAWEAIRHTYPPQNWYGKGSMCLDGHLFYG